MADGDEFIRFPSSPEEYLARCAGLGCNVVVGNFVDRISIVAPFPQITESERLDDLFPYGYPATRQIRGGWDRKVVALRGKFLSIEGPFYDGRHALGQKSGYATATRDARMLKLTDCLRSRALRRLVRNLYSRWESAPPEVRQDGERLEVHHFAWDSVLRDKVQARLRHDANNTHPLEFTKVMAFIEATPPTRMLKAHLLEQTAIGI